MSGASRSYFIPPEAAAASIGELRKGGSASTKQRKLWTQVCENRGNENGPLSVLPENPLRKDVARKEAKLSVHKSRTCGFGESHPPAN